MNNRPKSSKEFTEWYNEYFKGRSGKDCVWEVMDAWEACKKEALNILSSNLTEIDIINLPSKDWNSVLKLIREKVKNL